MCIVLAGALVREGAQRRRGELAAAGNGNGCREKKSDWDRQRLTRSTGCGRLCQPYLTPSPASHVAIVVCGITRTCNSIERTSSSRADWVRGRSGASAGTGARDARGGASAAAIVALRNPIPALRFPCHSRRQINKRLRQSLLPGDSVVALPCLRLVATPTPTSAYTRHDVREAAVAAGHGLHFPLFLLQPGAAAEGRGGGQFPALLPAPPSAAPHSAARTLAATRHPVHPLLATCFHVSAPRPRRSPPAPPAPGAPEESQVLHRQHPVPLVRRRSALPARPPEPGREAGQAGDEQAEVLLRLGKFQLQQLHAQPAKKSKERGDCHIDHFLVIQVLKLLVREILK